MRRLSAAAAAVPLLVLALAGLSLAEEEAPSPASRAFWSSSPRVRELREALGVPRPSHAVEPDPAQIARGRELLTRGWTFGPDGQRTKQQSRGFVCTDCHNLEREDPDLRVSDPEARLDYVAARGLPLLPATTLWGVVDRESWFNDDYLQKYGALVDKAHGSLREAIQLCSVECSQGRRLDDWELDAILAFLATRSIGLDDLPAGAPGRPEIEAARAGDSDARAAVLASLRASYLPQSPATFADPPATHDKDSGYGIPGDAARGERVYRSSCLWCHAAGGPGEYRMSFSPGKARELLHNMPRHDKWSFYEAIRHGTPVRGGHYMPQFTTQRLSDRQVEDLRAFLEKQAAR
jgi:mono/diheme cytochrome c family protein